MKQTFFTWLVLFLSGTFANAFGQTETSSATSPTPMANTTALQNKEVIRNLYELVLNQRNMQLLPDYFSPEYAGPGGLKGPAGFEKPLSQLIMSFPDIHWTLDVLVAEGNEVAVKWHWQGTHTAPFLYIPATGKKVVNDGMAIYELENGKIIKAQPYTDRLGFQQQVGWLPEDLSTLSKYQVDPAQVFFIDQFHVPQAAVTEFTARMLYNRNFIKQQPGFVRDEVYKQTDEAGNMVVVTVAVWADQSHLDAAKNAVQAEYKRIGFDPQAFTQQLGIRLERGIYIYSDLKE